MFISNAIYEGRSEFECNTNRYHMFIHSLLLPPSTTTSALALYASNSITYILPLQQAPLY